MASRYLYVPVLRLKDGERTALARLSQVVAERILPHLVIPPKGEPDPEKGRPLTDDELVYLNAERVLKYWPAGPCIFDWRCLARDFGFDDAGWLHRFCDLVSAGRSDARPVVAVDAHATELIAARTFSAKTGSGVAIKISLEDLASGDVGARLMEMCRKLDVATDKTIVISDFSDAELQPTDAFASFLIAHSHQLASAASWELLVFEGASYPAVNPAAKGSHETVPRLEWQAWNTAAHDSGTIEELPVFGDFGPDTSDLRFKRGRAPIPHLRYALDQSWHIERGADKASIRDVAKKVANLEGFAGRGFSAGDEFISDCADFTGGPGSPTTWRMANVNHHITLTVFDIADLYGIRLQRRVASPQPVQGALFEKTGSTP